MSVRRVAPEVVRPLRQKVLRPHQAVADQVYVGDDQPGAGHFAAYDGDAVVGTASITPEPHPRDPRPGDWRIRGMATDPDRGRGTGAGAALLDACLAHARAEGATRIWCNARTPAVGFYTRAGFTTEGDEFTLPAIGPHHLMSLTLRGQTPEPTPLKGSDPLSRGTGILRHGDSPRHDFATSWWGQSPQQLRHFVVGTVPSAWEVEA